MDNSTTRITLMSYTGKILRVIDDASHVEHRGTTLVCKTPDGSSIQWQGGITLIEEIPVHEGEKK